MAAVGFLHHEKSPDLSRNPQPWVQKASDKPTTSPSRPKSNMYEKYMSREYVRKQYLTIKIIRIMILLRLSQEQNEAPTEGKALGPLGP
ncbi:hypothetical protein TNCV_2072661 [Trichonephila clavipes]|nr:hypothetical protein TNCV_2072661 [Trichonephila clavipes]